MTKKSITRNLASLKSIRDRKQNKVNTVTLQKINNIIDLNEDRKIVSIWHRRKIDKRYHRNG